MLLSQGKKHPDSNKNKNKEDKQCRVHKAFGAYKGTDNTPTYHNDTVTGRKSFQRVTPQGAKLTQAKMSRG